MTIPCMSWDISTSIVYPINSPFTFKVQAKSNLGFTYTSNQISIAVLADYPNQPQIQTGIIPQQGQTYILIVGQTPWLFEIDQFTEIIFQNDIANYILTTDTTQLSQNLNSPGCAGFLDSNIQGVPQPNGKIGFTINTASVATACPVKVYAEVQQQTQIFAFTGVFSISVECGSETISLHSSIPQPDELVYTLEQSTAQKLFSVTSHQVTGTPIFISSIPTQCDIDHNKYSRDESSQGCSPLAGSQVTLDGTNLKFNADSIFQETICIKAETAKVSNSPILYRLKITVCGLQTLSPANILESQKSHLINQGEPKVVNFENSWFDQVYQFSSSEPSCVQTLTYELKVGSSCQNIANPSDFVLDTLSLTITLTAQSSMQSQILCLQASAYGKIATQYLNIEVCGDEQISYQRFSNFSELHTFERSSDTSSTNRQVNFPFPLLLLFFIFEFYPVFFTSVSLVFGILLSVFQFHFFFVLFFRIFHFLFSSSFSYVKLIHLYNLSMNFDSSRVNCPISFRLVGQQIGIQTSLTIDESSGDLSLNTLHPFEFEGIIQAYSHNDRATFNSDKIRIHVCGFESIDKSNYKFYYESYVIFFAIGDGLKSKRIILDLFNESLNNTKCPFKSFTLMQYVSPLNKYGYFKELEEPFKSDFSLKDDKVYVNTDLNLKVYKKRNGFDSRRTETFEFYIEGITAGLVKQQRKIIVIMTQQYMSFSGQEYKFNIYVCREPWQNKCADRWKQITLFEPVIDSSAPQDQFDMLDQIIIPSSSFDQPNGESTNDPKGICYVNVVISKTKQEENTVKFLMQNPGYDLPLHDILNAVLKYISFNIKGISTDNIECSQKVKSGAEQGFNGETMEELFRISEQGQQFDELLREVESFSGVLDKFKQDQVFQGLKQEQEEVEVKRMRMKSIEIFYDESNKMFLDVNFDMKLMPLSDFQVNILPNVLILNVKSAIDQSKFRGMWIPKKQGRTLQQNETSNGSKQFLNYKQSKHFVSQSFESLQFYWGLYEQQEKRLRFKIDFQYPYNVSRNNFGQDIIQMTVIENEILRDFDNGNPLDLQQTGQEITTNLKPMRTEPKVEQQIRQSVNTVSIVVLALQSSSMFKNLILSKGLQDIWGIIFTQIIVIHMILFKCQQTTPPNIYVFNSYLSQLAQKDMYPTDEIYGAIFDFEDQDSPVDHFEFLGYEGVIFISLSGSIIINLLIPIVVLLFSQVFKRLVRCFPNIKIFRSIAVYLGVPDLIKTIKTLYMASFLELIFCSVISIFGQKNAGFEKGKPSNIISAVFMVISIMIMSMIVIANVYVARKYRDQLQYPIIQKKYGFIYEGYKTDKFVTAIFQVVFMVRRIIFVMIIILLKEYSGMQIIANVALTHAYIAYLAHFKPFEKLEQNKNEIFNDVCTMLVSYFLMWLSTFPDYTEEELDTVNTIGWFYVCTASLNIVVNLLKLSYQSTINLPKKWKQVKTKYRDWKYERWKKNFLKQQLQNLKAAPNDQLFKHFANEAQKIQTMEEYKAELKKLNAKHQKDSEWLLKINIDDQRYKEFIQECQRTESYELQKKYFGNLKSDFLRMNMVNVKLEICDMIPISMPHNQGKHIIVGNPFPYKEHIYLEKQQEVLKDGKKPSEEEARMFNRQIFILRQKHLLKFLDHQQYSHIPIVKDGNSGPRAISVLKFGNQDHWRTIRDKVCQKMESDLIKKYKGKKHKKSFKKNLKRIEKIKSGKEGSQQFSDRELQVCSDLYNMTIVVFSLFSKMRFMDVLIRPTANTCKPSVPLYLLHHQNQFTVLVHKSQPNLQKFYRKNGSNVRPFEHQDFMAENDDLIESLKQNVFKTVPRESTSEEEQSGEQEDKDTKESKVSVQKSLEKKTKKKLSRQGKNEKLTKSALLGDVDKISENNDEYTPSERSQRSNTLDQQDAFSSNNQMLIKDLSQKDKMGLGQKHSEVFRQESQQKQKEDDQSCDDDENADLRPTKNFRAFLSYDQKELQERKNKKKPNSSQQLAAKTKWKLNINYQVNPNQSQPQKDIQKGTNRKDRLVKEIEFMKLDLANRSKQP